MRRLLFTPATTIAVIITFAISIGALTAVFTVLKGVILAPLPYPDPERLVVVHETQTNAGLSGQPASYLNFLDWRQHNKSFEELGVVRQIALTVTEGSEPVRVSGLRITPETLSLLGVQPLFGRLFDASEGTPGKQFVTILGFELWQRRFAGDRTILGRTIHYEGRPYEIVGVLPKGVRYPGIRVPAEGADAWIPYTPAGAENQRQFHSIRVVGRLKAGVSLEQARQDLQTIAADLTRQYPVTNTGYETELLSLHDQLTGQAAPAIWALTAAAAFLLTLACLNVASVLLASSSGRVGEFAVRAALGGTRWDVARQLVTEGLLLSFAGGLLGLLLAYGGVPLLLALGGTAIPRNEEVSISPSVILFAGGVSIVAALISSGLPVFRTGRTLADASGGRKGSAVVSGNRYILQALTVTEIAVALVLLTGTGLIIRSLQNLANVEVGIDPGNVTTASIALPLSRYADQKAQARFIDEYLARLNQTTGIEGAAMTFRLPVVGFATATFTVEGQPVGNGEEPWADYRAVSTKYFRVMRTPLERGRVFTEMDNENAPDVVIVNRALAERFWPGEDPIGKKLQIGAERKRFRSVVGVARDVHMSTLDLPIGPSIYVPHRQNSWVNALANSFVVVRSAQAGLDPASSIRAVVRELDRELAVAEPRTMEDLVRGSMTQRRFIATLFTVFGILGYLLAAVGIYGVVSNMVSQRTYEFAMRAVLGASPGTTFAQIVGRGVVLGAVGCAVGLILTVYLTPYLSAQLFGIAPRDPSTLAGTVALLIAVAAIACARPAWKAMCVDPIRSLKGER